MPDLTPKLLRAVVEIGTQLRRLADAQTTPVADDTDAPTTTPDNGRRITSWLPTSPELAAQRAETMNMLERYINGQMCPTPETHNWGCGCPTDTSALRMELDGQRQKANDLAETVKAQRAEITAIVQQRERLRGTLHEVLCTFAVGAAYGERPTYTLVSPVSKDTYVRWCQVVDQPDAPRTTPVEHLEQRAQEAADEMARLRERATFAEARASQLDDLLRVAHETSNRSEAERARAMRIAEEAEARAAVCREDAEHNATRAETAEQRRDQLAATHREVLSAFTRAIVNGKTAFYQNEHPIAPQDYQRWRAVLNPPANEEQPGPAPAAFPEVKGRCPACGGSSSLFLGSGGYVTCARIDCPTPDAASTLLENEQGPQCRAECHGNDPVRRCIRPARHTEDHAADDGWHWLEDIAVYPTSGEQQDPGGN